MWLDCAKNHTLNEDCKVLDLNSSSTDLKYSELSGSSMRSSGCRLRAEISPLPRIGYCDDEDVTSEETKCDSLQSDESLRQATSLSPRSLNVQNSLPIQMNSCCSDFDLKLFKGIVGFDNPDMFSYMNSVLQTLISIEPFVQYFVCKVYQESLNSSNKVFCMLFNRLFQAVFSRNSGTVVPSPFWKFVAPKFPIGRMHDAVDFLRFILVQLTSEFNGSTTNIISSLFEFSYTDNYFCKSCKYNKKLVTSSCILDLNLTENLTESLKRFLTSHKLKDKVCLNCKAKSFISMYSEFEVHPTYLILHIKRFLHIETFIKVSKPYEFHKNLELTS